MIFLSSQRIHCYISLLDNLMCDYIVRCDEKNESEEDFSTSTSRAPNDDIPLGCWRRKRGKPSVKVQPYKYKGVATTLLVTYAQRIRPLHQPPTFNPREQVVRGTRSEIYPRRTSLISLFFA